MRDFQIPFQPLEDVEELFFKKNYKLPSRGSAHGTIERELHIATTETRNEPGCMSNNPSHQGAVGGWSVLCALLHCRQHCTHLSLQLFLKFSTPPLPGCDRLGELRMTVRSDRLDFTLSAHLTSDSSGSHCRMTSERPGKLNIFHCPHCCERVCWAFMSTTVDMPCPHVLTYMLSTFSPPVAATSFNMR